VGCCDRRPLPSLLLLLCAAAPAGRNQSSAGPSPLQPLVRIKPTSKVPQHQLTVPHQPCAKRQRLADIAQAPVQAGCSNQDLLHGRQQQQQPLSSDSFKTLTGCPCSTASANGLPCMLTTDRQHELNFQQQQQQQQQSEYTNGADTSSNLTAKAAAAAAANPLHARQMTHVCACRVCWRLVEADSLRDCVNSGRHL